MKINFSYKHILDVILKNIPSTIDPDNLNDGKIQFMFKKLQSELIIDKNLFNYFYINVKDLLNSYSICYEIYKDEYYDLINKEYFEKFRVNLNEYKYKFAILIKNNNINGPLESITNKEIVEYNLDDIEGFIRNCFYINIKKSPNIVYISNNFIKMIYTYYGLENQIPNNIDNIVCIDNINNSSYSNIKSYEEFVNFIVCDIKIKFEEKQNHVRSILNNNYVKK